MPLPVLLLQRRRQRRRRRAGGWWWSGTSTATWPRGRWVERTWGHLSSTFPPPPPPPGILGMHSTLEWEHIYIYILPHKINERRRTPSCSTACPRAGRSGAAGGGECTPQSVQRMWTILPHAGLNRFSLWLNELMQRKVTLIASDCGSNRRRREMQVPAVQWRVQRGAAGRRYGGQLPALLCSACAVTAFRL